MSQGNIARNITGAPAPTTEAAAIPACTCAVVETRPTITVGGCEGFGVPNGEYVPKADYDALAAKLEEAEATIDNLVCADLDAAGIDMKPAYARLRAMIAKADAAGDPSNNVTE